MRNRTFDVSGEFDIKLELDGYGTLEKLGRHADICLYRLQRHEDGLLAIAKTTRDAYPDEKQTAAFRHEYELLQRLEGRGALEVYGMEFAGERPVLLLQDIGGDTLDQVIRSRGEAADLRRLLGVAVSAAKSLMLIHREKVTLNEISPFHLIANSDTHEVKFIDVRMWSDSSACSPLSALTDRPDELLPYLSPEGTGRTGAASDYRADFYSLGVTLYEWLSGSLPFNHRDAVDIVYQHLAVAPPALYRVKPVIPRMVSDIIGKCMDKIPHSRYESAYGLKADLEKCLASLQSSGVVEPFLLSAQDVPQRPKVPTQVYGREEEKKRLRAALRRCASGSAEWVGISGGGGIGKTSFVQETLRGSVDIEAAFATGKFDPNRAMPPYDVWMQAIDDLIVRLLTESKLEVEVWRLRILQALDGYGQLLIERVPKLELLIGLQPSVAALPPLESQRRFYLILNRFFQLFALPERPLILFLDDLQWADEASLQYMEYLLEDRETRHTLVVAAYRDDEPETLQAIGRMEKRFEGLEPMFTYIRLHELTAADVDRLLGDAMFEREGDRGELVSLLLQKTDGNPLFLKQFLQDLFDGGGIAFDEMEGSWTWSVQSIAETSVADNAATYISEKLNHLPESIAQALCRAAFLGSSFTLGRLLPLTGLTKNRLLDVLENAVREGLLQSVNRELGQYAFEHDRVQQAAYDMATEEQRNELHLRIGKELAHRVRSGEEADMFEAVYHLNRAGNRSASLGEKREQAELNMAAAMKAKASTAYETALGYIRRAVNLHEDVDWNKEYGHAFLLYREWAELEFLCLHYQEAERLFQLLIAKAETHLDKARVYNLMMQLAASQDNYAEVISYGRSALALLGVRLPETPSTLRLVRQSLRLSRKLRKHPIETLTELPEMKDEAGRIAISVLTNITNGLFFTDKKCWLAATFEIIELTLERGQTPEASIGFVGYSMYHYSFNRLEECFRWGMLAYEWSKPYPLLHVKTITAFSLCYDSWRKYKPEMLDRFCEHAGRVGLESGDLWQGNQSVIISCSAQFHFGAPLRKIYERMIAHSGEFRRHRNVLLWKQGTLLVSMLTELSGHRDANDPFAPEEIRSESFFRSVRGDELRLIERLVYISTFILGYIFGRYREANEALRRISALPGARKDNSENYLLCVYEVLVWAQLYEEMPAEEKSATWPKLRKRRNVLEKIARRCPEGYQHKFLFVKAEIAKLQGKDRKAEELFAQSIDFARKHGHIHDLAMAAESCGKHGLRQGKLQMAKVYLMEAYEAYLQWGATAKAAVMEREYGYLLNAKLENGLERIDYLSVARSAQALSGEMDMNRLLDALMRIMLHNSGAEYGALLFESEGRWDVEIRGTSEELRIESLPLEEAVDWVPASIVGYAARTREVVVLGNAAEAGVFTRDPYVRDKGLKSVLCLPLLYQNKRIGLLYMENKLTPNVFTPERLDVLKLFGSQCAISLANAKLFADVQELSSNLEHQVEQRTRSLERSMLETSAALAEVSVYEERNRIAQEIHDIVGHTLTSTVIQIEAGRRLMSKDAEEAAQRLLEAQELVRHSLNEIRGSVHMLREDKYADLGSLLRQLILDTQRNTGVAIEADISEIPDLPTSHRKMIYYALQEGLTNGIRHGESAEFHFQLSDVPGFVRFRLQDYGKGSSAIRIGFGLKAMKDRAEQLGGSLTIEARAAAGCLLSIDLPFPRRRKEEMA